MLHMKRFTSETQKIGQKGEKIAVMFLVKRGFTIIEQNYTRKCGEIDIVAKKGRTLHFVEVKTLRKVLSHVKRPEYSPFDNVGRKKLERFARACQMFIAERHVSRETPWQIDVVSVVLDTDTKEAKVTILENVIF